MGRSPRSDQLRLPIAFSLNPGLPPGVRAKDCDEYPSRLADAGVARLWAACSPAQQESLSAQFADGCAEVLRDAILDLEDTSIKNPQVLAQNQRTSLGDLLWSSRIRFRNRALHEMRGQGELAGF